MLRILTIISLLLLTGCAKDLRMLGYKFMDRKFQSGQCVVADYEVRDFNKPLEPWEKSRFLTYELIAEVGSYSYRTVHVYSKTGLYVSSMDFKHEYMYEVIDCPTDLMERLKEEAGQ